MVFPILPANTLSGGYDIENSWRGNGSNSYFNRTLETPTSRRIWTFSVWTKRVPGTASNLMSFGPTAQYNDFRFNANDSLAWHIDDTVNSSSTQLTPTRLFRDPSAWMHIVLAVDTTQGTDTNRAKIYINNVQQTFTSVFPAQNYDFPGLAADQVTQVGTRTGNDFGYTTGYLADVAFVDGTQLTPSSFGEADEDSGIWKPKELDVTWGNSGFFLEFKQTGTSADASGKGADTSGNGNHFDDNNADAYDITTDTPTNNFCTLNPLDIGSDLRDNGSFAEGNLSLTNGDTTGQANQQRVRGTIGVTAGKWYFETKPTGGTAGIGVSATEADPHGGDSTNTLIMHYDGGGEIRYYNGSGRTTVSSGVDTYTDDDIVQCALDMDNNKVYFGKNGTWQMSGDPTSGATGTGAASIVAGNTMTPMGFDNSSGSAGLSSWNFGNPIHSISSGNADANGYGNFEYAPPSGYYALCTKNLAEFGG